jgi:hypothetical protein
MKTCDGCSFLYHGNYIHGVDHYNLTTSTATKCRKNCLNDTRCNGYTHRSSNNYCRLYETTQYQSANSCPDCSFYSKVCDTTTSKNFFLPNLVTNLINFIWHMHEGKVLGIRKNEGLLDAYLNLFYIV